ncbi:MAG: AAA family ATPase [Chloroflexi bacterium]|nr:AAA family ATPase [Chloroflexota bacterium]
MGMGATLIGREKVCEELGGSIAEAARGHGGLVLLSGESGVGKTRLVKDVLERTPMMAVVVPASPATATAYGPIIAALRGLRRAFGDDALAQNPLQGSLRALLPELGSGPGEVDRAILCEAVRNAFELAGRQEPCLVFLDDLHAADSATLELLPYLATELREATVLIVCAYRSDELGRDHPVRRMRLELRRGGPLREIQVPLLGADKTTALATQLLGERLTDALARLIFERSDGLPLFVEELTAELVSGQRLRQTPNGLDLAQDAALLLVPETVRDLVLLRAARLEERSRAALEAAAVAGVSFELDLVAELGGGDHDDLDAPLSEGLIVAGESGSASFRHALVRDALYADIPVPRRRAIHRHLAEILSRRRATSPVVLAEHWLAAREPDRARRALLVAMSEACSVHAYTEAAKAARRALELWPDGEEVERLWVLERLGHCAQISGNLSQAVSAWRELADAYEKSGASLELADIQRRLAGVYELQGAWTRALTLRESAAEAFVAHDRPADAATERLAAAIHLRLAGRFTAAMTLLATAEEEAKRADRLDLLARILGLRGNLQARLGQIEAGVAVVRSGLAVALEHNLTGVAAEVYQRLADALEQGSDYRAARATYIEAADFCQNQGASATEQLCRACMTVVLRQTGEWQQCIEVSRDVLASGVASTHARTVALGMFGSIHVLQGEPGRGRPLLQECVRLAQHIELAPMQILGAWGLAMVDDMEGLSEHSVQRCREFLHIWAQTEERHFAIPALRWATTLFATHQAASDARACANALADIVAATGAVEAVSALAHALGEVSLMDGDARQAVEHFSQALDNLEALELPFERAHTSLRIGLAFVVAGERQLAVERLVEAYRSARKLGARPLASDAARELATLGEAVEGKLGRRAASDLERGGLTRRELEVLRLVSDGHSDREIARRLVLSPRTAEMHVANGIAKLGCRSRAEAVRRAAELGLLESVAPRAALPTRRVQ